MPEISGDYCIPASHPCIAGHFPGNPIVPGVVILDYARCLLQQWQPDRRINTITQVKFRQPLYPGQPFSITLSQCLNAAEIKFDCLHNGQTIVSGAFLTEAV